MGTDWEVNIIPTLRSATFLLKSLGVPTDNIVAVLGCIVTSTFGKREITPTTPLEAAFKLADMFNRRPTTKDSLDISVRLLQETPIQERPKTFEAFVKSERGFREFLLGQMSTENPFGQKIAVPEEWKERLREDISVLENEGHPLHKQLKENTRNYL